jgi:glutamyl-tRNA synthetase
MEQILPLVYERLVRLTDFGELSDFFWQPVAPDPVVLVKKADRETVQNQLLVTESFLTATTWEKEKIEERIRTLTQEKGYKKSQYFMMLRVAITGKTATPPLFETMAVIGKQEVLRRIEQAGQLWQNQGKLDT